MPKDKTPGKPDQAPVLRGGEGSRGAVGSPDALRAELGTEQGTVKRVAGSSGTGSRGCASGSTSPTSTRA